jgi:hypothetical protein
MIDRSRHGNNATWGQQQVGLEREMAQAVNYPSRARCHST